MDVLVGKWLKIYLVNSAKEYKKRDCFQRILDFVTGPPEPRVMALYGLRRTGKTVLMSQALLQIDDIPHSCIIHCDYGDTMRDLKEALNAHDDCKYFVLDEVTALDNFIDTASTLSDYYASLGKKILMAGTDSLGFLKAAADSLFDRVHLIHTTYIPYQEYHRLLGKGLDEYIMYGGTLTEDRELYNRGNAEAYTNSAIAKNIQHSLAYMGRDGDFGALLPYYDRDELTTIINKQVELHNHTFILRTINKAFKSHDLGALRNYVEAGSLGDSTPLYSDKLKTEIQAALEIQDPLTEPVSPKALAQIKTYLEKMDVLYSVPRSDDVIFIQPGLRYAQVTKFMEILRTSPQLQAYSNEFRSALCEKIDQDVKGRLLEDIIFYQLLKSEKINKKYDVNKFRSETGQYEFDIALINIREDKVILFEVKHSAAYVPDSQTRHLVSREACNLLENSWHSKIQGKCVLYMGKTREYKDVLYLNAGKFLAHPIPCIQKIKDHFAKVVKIKY